jgi:transcriptional regulator with XRE-family HTH domain
VSTHPPSDQDAQRSRQFAVLLNHLFATRLAPQGRPFTLTEVSKATGLSVPYLSLLRKGTIGAVSLQRAEALARFFQVSLDYFRTDVLPDEMLQALSKDTLMQEALAQPLVREVALRAGKVGAAQRALVLQMLEHAEQVLQELDALPTTPSPEAPAPPGGDTPGAQET